MPGHSYKMMAPSNYASSAYSTPPQRGPMPQTPRGNRAQDLGLTTPNKTLLDPPPRDEAPYSEKLGPEAFKYSQKLSQKVAELGRSRSPEANSNKPFQSFEEERLEREREVARARSRSRELEREAEEAEGRKRSWSWQDSAFEILNTLPATQQILNPLPATQQPVQEVDDYEAMLARERETARRRAVLAEKRAIEEQIIAEMESQCAEVEQARLEAAQSKQRADQDRFGQVYGLEAAQSKWQADQDTVGQVYEKAASIDDGRSSSTEGRRHIATIGGEDDMDLPRRTISTDSTADLNSVAGSMWSKSTWSPNGGHTPRGSWTPRQAGSRGRLATIPSTGRLLVTPPQQPGFVYNGNTPGVVFSVMPQVAASPSRPVYTPQYVPTAYAPQYAQQYAPSMPGTPMTPQPPQRGARQLPSAKQAPSENGYEEVGEDSWFNSWFSR